MGLCWEFYQKLSVFGDDEGKLRTNVRGKTFEVTPATIATKMRYERPLSTTPVYPHNVDGGRTLRDYVALTYEDPTTFSGTTLVGGLKHSYGIMNKVLH